MSLSLPIGCKDHDTFFRDFAAANLVLSDGKTNMERLRRLTRLKEYELIPNYSIKSLLLDLISFFDLTRSIYFNFIIVEGNR